MKVIENEINVDLFYELYTSVGWQPPCTDQIETAINHSRTFCVVCEENTIIAMARLIGDVGMSYYIKDFVVVPSQQGKGIGRFLMQHIVDYISNQIKPGWAISLELISSKDKEPFYEKMGFEARPCEWDGAGMFMMIRK